MKFFSKDFFSKCDQIRSLLRIWSLWLKKSLMGNSIFCAVLINLTLAQLSSWWHFEILRAPIGDHFYKRNFKGTQKNLFSVF